MSIFDMTAEQLVQVKKFTISDLPMGPNQRFTVFREPCVHRNYVIGADFAHGMQEGDYDVATVFDRNSQPWEQVAVLQGRWGETQFHKVLYALIRMYNDAFLVGERQVGLATLRMLVDAYSVTYLYFSKDEGRVGKPMSDRLGHSTVQNDITLTDLRRVVRDNPTNPQLLIYDKPTLLEIEKMQWQAHGAKTQQAMLAGRAVVADRQLKASAPPKFHDDLVIATALALKGLNCVGEYEEVKPKYAAGTYGSIYPVDEILAKQDEEIAAGTIDSGGVGVRNRFLRRM